MNLIAIDTSTRWAGVGLQTASGEKSEMVWRSDQNHGRELMPAIAELTDRAGITPANLTHVAVALGPGGFSAVRVGISTALGLALPNDLPLIGVPTHQIEAHPYFDVASAASPLVSLLPAGRGELAWAKFESPDAEPEIGLATFDEFVAGLDEGAKLCGEGAELLAEQLPAEQILSGEPPTRSPLSMLEIATQRVESGDTTPLTELRPIYARPPSITMKKAPT